MSFTTSEAESAPGLNDAGAHPPASVPAQPVIIQFQQGAVTGPRASKRVQWLALAEEGEYAGHQVKARIRYPDTLNTEFSSGDFARIRGALRQVVLEHNGWIDPDTDAVYPPAQGQGSEGFWDNLAQEEILLILRAVGTERKKVLSLLLEMKTD